MTYPNNKNQFFIIPPILKYSIENIETKIKSPEASGDHWLRN